MFNKKRKERERIATERFRREYEKIGDSYNNLAAKERVMKLCEDLMKYSELFISDILIATAREDIDNILANSG